MLYLALASCHIPAAQKVPSVPTATLGGQLYGCVQVVTVVWSVHEMSPANIVPVRKESVVVPSPPAPELKLSQARAMVEPDWYRSKLYPIGPVATQLLRVHVTWSTLVL